VAPRLYIFHKHGGILHSRSYFAITALIVHLVLGVLDEGVSTDDWSRSIRYFP